MEKSLENRVEQVSRQVDDVSLRRAYPTLGQEMFVTYGGTRWKGLKEKAQNERWVNISIDPMAVGDFSADQLEKLMVDLKGSGYTPLPGMFGFGGPVSSGYGGLGNTGARTAVIYFKRDSESMATAVCALVSKDLSISNMEPKFVDPKLQDENLRFVIERSGLDLQLVLFHSPR